MELSRDMNTVGGTGTSGNCSAASAKVANEPAICVSGPRVTLNAWNRRFTVDLSGARPRQASSYQSLVSIGRTQPYGLLANEPLAERPSVFGIRGAVRCVLEPECF